MGTVKGKIKVCFSLNGIGLILRYFWIQQPEMLSMGTVAGKIKVCFSLNGIGLILLLFWIQQREMLSMGTVTGKIKVCFSFKCATACWPLFLLGFVWFWRFVPCLPDGVSVLLSMWTLCFLLRFLWLLLVADIGYRIEFQLSKFVSADISWLNGRKIIY